mmetsp:Transcript_18517/g.51870  ORF Transcript_18517/g.51870 Transcript_18517/m.51870 type:complete len:276 (-) Transcript_18517:268-1095(-)
MSRWVSEESEDRAFMPLAVRYWQCCALKCSRPPRLPTKPANRVSVTLPPGGRSRWVSRGSFARAPSPCEASTPGRRSTQSQRSKRVRQGSCDNRERLHMVRGLPSGGVRRSPLQIRTTSARGTFSAQRAGVLHGVSLERDTSRHSERRCKAHCRQTSRAALISGGPRRPARLPHITSGRCSHTDVPSAPEVKEASVDKAPSVPVAFLRFPLLAPCINIALLRGRLGSGLASWAAAPQAGLNLYGFLWPMFSTSLQVSPFHERKTGCLFVVRCVLE